MNQGVDRRGNTIQLGKMKDALKIMIKKNVQYTLSKNSKIQNNILYPSLM